MIITFEGTKGDVPTVSPKHRLPSSITVYHNPTTLLVDFGEGYENVPSNVSAILLTHAHPDHAFGLKDKTVDVPVYLNKFSNRLLDKEHYSFHRKIFWRNPFTVEGIKVTPVPVIHSVKAPTSGFLFEAKGRKLAYFPDVLRIKDLNVLKNTDVYIGDGSALDRDIIHDVDGKKVGHASIRTQLNWLASQGVKRAVFTHFGKWATSLAVREAFQELEKEFNIKVVAASDNMKIRCGTQIVLQHALPGIYLVPPHARLISEGYKTLIVSTKRTPEEYVNKPLYFVQDNKVYGILKITETHGPISRAEIMRLRDRTQISDEEFDKWWPEQKEFYYSEFEVQKLFIPPKDFKVPPGVQKWITSVKLESSEQIQKAAETQSTYAPVRHYGETLGRKITLKEILDAWSKPIMLKKGYITVVGGLTNWGETKGDIDILQKEVEEITDRDQPVIFRLGRALEPELAERLRRRFIGDYGGPFTSHVEVYDLVLVPSTDRRLVQMERIEALKDPEGRRQAAASLKEDKVIPGRYVAPLKGYRAYYMFPEEAVMDIAHEYSAEDYPIYAQKKYDGAITEWVKHGDSLTVRTDAGFDVTDRFPTLVKVAKKILPEDCTILCETEMWIDKVHQPREMTSGYLNSKTPANDSNLTLNVFDMPYCDEDLHKLGYAERYKRMRAIKWPQSTDEVPKPGFNLTPSVLVESSKELLSALKKTASYVASEGTVLKSAQMKYELDGLTHKMLKWKKMAEIHGIVLDKTETKTPGVFTLYVGLKIPKAWKVPKGVIKELDNKTYMYIGKTFNVASPVKIGDVVDLTFHTMNHYVRPDGTQNVTIYEPKFINKSTHDEPDDALQAIEVARQKELLVKKRLQTFPMDDKPHESVMQIHYRGQSAHMDFRIKINHYLLGPTMFIEIPNAIKEDVTSVAQAKSIERNWEHYFKLRNVPQTEITAASQKIRVTWKAPEPLDWLNVERVVGPGEVGATRTEYGVFSIVDKPTVYFGAQKPYFKEFFIYGKLIDGRWVIRYLPNPWKAQEPRVDFVFLMWKPEDQVPYVLSERAKQKKWVPPFGVSCLPPNIRKSIPSEFKYWVKKENTERLTVRDALINAIKAGRVKLAKLQSPPDVSNISTQAVLQHHWWRGQFVIRGGPSTEHWDLRIDYPKTGKFIHFVLYENPQYTNETLGEFQWCSDRSWLDIKGIKELKPGSVGNPSKNTPAFVEQIDEGTAEIFESKATFMKVKFAMKQLKGLFTFIKADPRQNLWVVKKTEAAP
jgi:ATP-dependent DNA ligase/phosphoribosyl 1,2-cyclic phosphodiesterase